MKLVLICITSLILISSPPAKEINYHHKSVNKQIKKIWGWENFSINEIVNDALTRSDHGKYFKVLQEDQSPRYIYIGRVNSCRQGGCQLDESGIETNAYEYFDYFILFNEETNVDLVKVFNYAATHGQEISSRSWLKQFIGHHADNDLIVGKNIDAISGATISVYSITYDVQQKSKILLRIIHQNNLEH